MYRLNSECLAYMDTCFKKLLREYKGYWNIYILLYKLNCFQK